MANLNLAKQSWDWLQRVKLNFIWANAGNGLFKAILHIAYGEGRLCQG